jgi:DNA-binding NarL/FixJ family response regulator
MSSPPRCETNSGVERAEDSKGTGPENPIRVVLGDDHAGFREGLKEMLATDGGIEVVGEAGDGAAVIELAREMLPDVVILDLAMPKMGGREALELILREISPPPGVVILTMHDQRRLVRELLGMGASAFLAKSASLAELIATVKGSVPKHQPREPSDEVPPPT